MTPPAVQARLNMTSAELERVFRDVSVTLEAAECARHHGDECKMAAELNRVIYLSSESFDLMEAIDTRIPPEWCSARWYVLKEFFEDMAKSMPAVVQKLDDREITR